MPSLRVFPVALAVIGRRSALILGISGATIAVLGAVCPLFILLLILVLISLQLLLVLPLGRVLVSTSWRHLSRLLVHIRLHLI